MKLKNGEKNGTVKRVNFFIKNNSTKICCMHYVIQRLRLNSDDADSNNWLKTGSGHLHLFVDMLVDPKRNLRI